uniref:Uncharacterized protein n=1 Tax=Anguilla anguilla TaxID=7936 RepID=A0A0E9QSM6_ANGAN
MFWVYLCDLGMLHSLWGCVGAFVAFDIFRHSVI